MSMWASQKNSLEEDAPKDATVGLSGWGECWPLLLSSWFCVKWTSNSKRREEGKKKEGKIPPGGIWDTKSTTILVSHLILSL